MSKATAFYSSSALKKSSTTIPLSVDRCVTVLLYKQVAKITIKKR
jgi:hypothetical protein